MNFFVYVIGSNKKTKITYVGWTTNIKKRILKHNKGKGAKFTRGRKWKLLYYEKLKSKNIAMKREHEIKKNIKLRKILRLKI